MMDLHFSGEGRRTRRYDLLHHEDHELHTFIIQESFFHFGLSQRRADAVKHVLHKLYFLAVSRIFLEVLLLFLFLFYFHSAPALVPIEGPLLRRHRNGTYRQNLQHHIHPIQFTQLEHIRSTILQKDSHDLTCVLLIAVILLPLDTLQ